MNFVDQTAIFGRLPAQSHLNSLSDSSLSHSAVMELSLLLTLLLCSPILGARLNLRQETTLDPAGTTSIATSTTTEISTTSATDTTSTRSTTSGTSTTRTTGTSRSGTSLPKPVPLLPCRFADKDFFAVSFSASSGVAQKTNANPEYHLGVQSPDHRRSELSKAWSQHRGPPSCGNVLLGLLRTTVRDQLPRASLRLSNPFVPLRFYSSYECTGWEARKDGAISLWKPFGHPTLTTPRFDPLPVPQIEKGDCQYPDFLPVCLFVYCSDQRLTAAIRSSKRPASPC